MKTFIRGYFRNHPDFISFRFPSEKTSRSQILGFSPWRALKRPPDSYRWEHPPRMGGELGKSSKYLYGWWLEPWLILVNHKYMVHIWKYMVNINVLLKWLSIKRLGISSSQLTFTPSFFRGVSSNHRGLMKKTWWWQRCHWFSGHIFFKCFLKCF